MPLDDVHENEWEDLFAMLADIHGHVQTTGRPVELDDNPMQLVMGYRDTEGGRAWRIRLTKVKASLVAPEGHEQTEQQRLGSLGVRTCESRLRLANYPIERPTGT